MEEMNSNMRWYFAIGSMMNPTSLKGRNLYPISSQPGEILDFELKFFGEHGMAEAVPCEGKSFHGVLHYLTEEELLKLDNIEMKYDRFPCSVRLYDGHNLNSCCVYVKNVEKCGPLDNEVCNLPAERYIDILIQGCQHFGVKESHINFLQNHPKIPRKLPSEFRQLEVSPDLPVWTIDDVVKGNGLDGNPVYFSLNGKVIEYLGRDTSHYLHKLHVSQHAGKHHEIFLSKCLYEPKYGMFDTIEEFSREHCAYLEEMHIYFTHHHSALYRVVAVLNQSYKD